MSIAQVDSREGPRTPIAARKIPPLVLLEGFASREHRDAGGPKIKVKGYIKKIYSGGFKYEVVDATTGETVYVFP